MEINSGGLQLFFEVLTLTLDHFKISFYLNVYCYLSCVQMFFFPLCTVCLFGSLTCVVAPCIFQTWGRTCGQKIRIDINYIAWVSVATLAILELFLTELKS